MSSPSSTTAGPSAGTSLASPTGQHAPVRLLAAGVQQSTLACQVRVLTARSLRGAFGDPRLVFFGLLQPVVLLVLFSQVFRQIGTLATVAQYRGYINYLMPATAVNIALTTAMGSAAGVLAEIYTGFIGRLRTMPINLTCVLLARTLADATRLAIQLLVITACAALFLDYRPASGPGLVLSLAVTVFVGWAIGWLFVALATWQRKAETMQAASFLVMFPLMFTSSAYIPISELPRWLRAVAQVNPLTYAIDSTRRLTAGQPVGMALSWTLLSAAAIAAAGAFIARRNFRRAS